MDVFGAKDDRKFELECRAGKAGQLRVGTDTVCVKVGQRVRMDGAEEIWHSVGVYAKEDEVWQPCDPSPGVRTPRLRRKMVL